MRQLVEVYNKLCNKIPPSALKYDEGQDLLVYENSSVRVHFTKVRDSVMMSMFHGDKQYDHMLRKVEEAYYIIRRFDKEKVDLEFDGVNSVKATGLEWYRYNHKPLWAKIFMTTIGSLIVILCGIIALAGILTLIKRPPHKDFSDIAILIMLFFFIYAGASIIMNAFGFQVYEAVHFFGVLMLGFSTCMLLCGINDFNLELSKGIRNLIGDILLFGFVFAAGFFVLWLSFFKRKKDVLYIRRTAQLPPNEEMDRLYDRIYELHKKEALAISITEDEPVYSGSRIGGVPYSDGTITTPLSYDGKEMKFLMQINLGKICQYDYGSRDSVGSDYIPRLPENGLLQFFITDRDGYRGDVKALYYPHIDSLKNDDVGKSKAIRIVPQEMADVWNLDMDMIRSTAAELGIELVEDLEIGDFYNYRAFEVSDRDFLMGPIRLMPPCTEIDLGDRRVIIPLLSVSSESPIIYTFCENIGNTYFEGFQTFISKAALQEADFSGVITTTETIFR